MKRVILGILLTVLLASLPQQALGAEQGVEVGGIHLLNTDMSGRPLEGAEFQIVREMELEEQTDRSMEKKLVKIGDQNCLVSVMSFWTEREMTGSRQQKVRTDSQGKAAVYGLSYGTYYLVETKAPEGYDRITSPIRVSIHRYSHLTAGDQVLDDEGALIDNTLHIINVRYTLSDAYSWGTVQLTAAAVGILFSSTALILLNRRRRGW